MTNEIINIKLIDFWILFGALQGILIACFFLKKSFRTSNTNFVQGLLILSFSLVIFEEFLNNTGLILKLLWLTDFSEPLNLAFGPLVFLTVKYSLQNTKHKTDLLHFAPATLWTFYLIFFFIQPNEFKYNAFVYSKHPGWEYHKIIQTISSDPLNIRWLINYITAIQIIAYIFLTIFVLHSEIRKKKQLFFKLTDETLKQLRNSTLHFFTIGIIFLVVKINFERDLGDQIIGSYISFVILLTSFRILNKSEYFSETHFFLETKTGKYGKSTLTEKQKLDILQQIDYKMKEEKYFKQNLASLTDLSKRLNQTTHNLSQVINEKTGKSFYKLLANYRIEEAKIILEEDKSEKVTIEELAEMVGYNSKSSFYNAFKTQTGQTPNQFRKGVSKL